MSAHLFYTPEDQYVTFVWGGGYIDVYSGTLGYNEAGELVGLLVDVINVYDYKEGGTALDGAHANDVLRKFEAICDAYLAGEDEEAEEDDE